MAPEVNLSKPKTYTVKSEVYSFGLVVWEMYQKQTLAEYYNDYSKDKHIVRKNITDKLRPKIGSDCLGAIRAIIERCWDQEPDKRPAFDDPVFKNL